MPAGVPPPPLNSPSGSYYWLEWYTNLTNFLNGTNIPWSNINFTGANIADLPAAGRNHNSLANVQGGTASQDKFGTGNAFHMKGAEFIGFVGSTGTAVSLPVGWTSSATGAAYTITHNLALAANTYVITATASGGSANVVRCDLGTNSFVLTLSAAQNFSFSLQRGS